MATLARMLLALSLLVAPTAARSQNWNGFNAGLHLGYGFGNGGFSVTPGGAWIGDPDLAGIIAAGTAKVHANGALVGLHLGYDRQFDQIVAGLLVDASLMNLSGSYATPVFPGVFGGIYWAGGSIGSDWLVTFRGRIGLANGPWLFFLTGGLAIADEHFRHSINFLNFCGDCVPGLPLTGPAGGANAAAGSRVVAGLTLGAGLEFAIDRNWSLRVEYLHLNFGSFHRPSRYVEPGNGGVYDMIHHARLSGTNIVKFGFSYGFGT